MYKVADYNEHYYNVCIQMTDNDIQTIVYYSETINSKIIMYRILVH